MNEQKNETGMGKKRNVIEKKRSLKIKIDDQQSNLEQKKKKKKD